MSCKLETWENGGNACFECIIDGEVGSARAGWRQQSPSRAGRWGGGSRLLLVVIGRRMVIVMLLSMIAIMMTIRSQWLLVRGAYGGNDPIYFLFTITPPITNPAPSVQREPRTVNLKVQPPQWLITYLFEMFLNELSQEPIC